MTMEHRPVGFRTACIMMPLHDSLISLSLRNTDDIHPVALFKNINLDGLPYRHIANLMKLSENPSGRSVRFLQMSQLGLRQLAFFYVTERQLNGLIPITLFCLDCDHAAGTCFNDG